MFLYVHSPRMDTVLDRRVLSGQAKSVEADGEEDVVAPHRLELDPIASVGVTMYQWPMCRSPDGYGYIVTR